MSPRFLHPHTQTMSRLAVLAAVLLATATLAHAQRVPVTSASDVARAHYVRGVHDVSYVNFPQARVHLDAAIAADPGFALAHLYRAVLSSGDQRAEHMRRAAAGPASDAERQMIEAYAANLRGDHDREEMLLAGVAERFPADPMPMFWWANTQANRGNHAQAVAAARRSLAADPSFAPAYNLMGYAEMAAGNSAAAEQAFREQIRLAPDEPNPYDSLGEFLLGQARLDDAERQFEMALARDPGFGNGQMNLARVAMERSDLRLEGAIADGDAEAAAALYAEDAVVMAPDAPRVRGREGIRDLMAGMIASGIDGADIQTVNVLRFDDWAVRESNVVLSAGGQVADRLKALELWRLIDGDWLYVRDVFNSDGPEAGGTD